MGQGDVVTTIIGNLTADPEIKWTASGDAVVNFTVASTPRQLDKQSGQWVDGTPLFMRCSQWREPAENTANSYVRGQRVLVVGRLRQRSFEVEGQKRTVIELEVDEMGPSTRYGVTKFEKRSGSGGSETGGNRQPAYSGGPAEDPWGAGPNTPSESTEEPPF